MIKYSKNILHLETFYVYSNFDKIKEHVTKGEILKGFGKHMLCKVLSYMMKTIPNITENTEIMLSAWGDQCYSNTKLDLELKDYPLETKFDILVEKLE